MIELLDNFVKINLHTTSLSKETSEMHQQITPMNCSMVKMKNQVIIFEQDCDKPVLQTASFADVVKTSGPTQKNLETQSHLSAYKIKNTLQAKKNKKKYIDTGQNNSSRFFEHLWRPVDTCLTVSLLTAQYA